LSRRKQIKSKSRKYIGGSLDDNEYILIGFGNTGHSSINFRAPFFLRNTDMIFTNTNTMNGFVGKEGTQSLILILSQLYKLQSMRGLDFDFIIRWCNFVVDGHITDMTETWHQLELFKNPSYDTNRRLSEQWLNENNEKRKKAIRQTELRYPGLFKRMFITPEEEQEALENIKQKEEEKKREELNEFEILQQKALEEMKQSILKELQTNKSNSAVEPELSQEEKNKIYDEEFENNQRLIPYIREEQLNKKKKKPTIKYIDDL
jgi:hypothetical protein